MLIDRFSSQAAQAVALLILGCLAALAGCDSPQRGRAAAVPPARPEGLREGARDSSTEEVNESPASLLAEPDTPRLLELTAQTGQSPIPQQPNAAPIGVSSEPPSGQPEAVAASGEAPSAVAAETGGGPRDGKRPEPETGPGDRGTIAQSSLPEPLAPSGFSPNPLRGGVAPSPGAVEPGVLRQESSRAAQPTAKKIEGKPFGKGKHSGQPFDPILENGPIFVGWEPPKLALVISGRQDGYLEPCGCAGLDRMKGGLSRRHMLFAKLEADGWPTLGLDCGGLVKGSGRQAELKFGMSIDAMQQMGYDAIALGKSDLRLPSTELLARVASTAQVQSPFVSANVAVFGFAMGMTADHRILEAGGLRVGVTSVLGGKWQKEINNPDIEMADPRARLREVLPKLEGKCDLMVLLAHATMEESVELAEAFPQFNVVVTAGGAPEPPDRAQPINGKTLLVEIGEKGMNAIVLGIYGAGQPIRYQRVPLDSRFPESAAMKMFMRQYQEQLKQDGLEGLGIRHTPPHPQKEELGRFVGSAECESCHEPSYDVWRKTGHAKAWETLKELDPPRHHDPECISCHVVGWHPTQYFPYESGFLSEEETPRLVDVGCESCHGPGEKHVAAEMGSNAELQKKLQQAMVVTKEQARSSKVHWCLNCHDLDNSPDFDFDEYWPHVEHKEYEDE